VVSNPRNRYNKNMTQQGQTKYIQMKKLFNYFLQGLIYVAPFAITLYVIYLIFSTIDGSLQSLFQKWFDIRIPGLGIVVIFLLISLLGFIGRSIVFKPLKKLFDNLMNRTPVVKLVYSSIRDLLNAFVGKEKKFNQPVLVKVNTISELEKVGFLTQEDLSDLGIVDKVAVYFPHSYNFSGEMFIVPKEHVRPFNMAPSEAMKFIVSGGIARNL
jgi:uncharacterized membrane protein